MYSVIRNYGSPTKKRGTQMSDFVGVENVFVNQSAATREEALRSIAQKAVDLGVAEDVDTVYQAFLDREGMGPTGMVEGFAIPHAKCSAINKAAVVVFKNDHALEWPSFDDTPVDICISLLVPEAEAGTTHIALLSKTAVLLMQDEFKELLRTTDDRQAIADAINAGIAGGED